MELGFRRFRVLGYALLSAIPATTRAQSGQPQGRPDRGAESESAGITAIPPFGSHGSDKAPITVVVFSDFESFSCARSASVLEGLVGNSKEIRVLFKHAPAASNPNALLAHEAALAAGAQGKFWDMHDRLFANQTKLSRSDLIGYARDLGVDLSIFQ